MSHIRGPSAISIDLTHGFDDLSIHPAPATRLIC
jgi:hypothetical protein